MPTEAGSMGRTRASAPSLAEVAAAFPHLEVVELIGVGGMGAVYKARQPKLDRWVALKVLPESLGRDATFAERFVREARVLARLNHPRIVAVYDFGQSGPYFHLVMEYVDGVNLRQAMRAGRFSPAQALALVPQICEALQFAHDAGVMHRDIKPENILLDARGRVKIADFGIAKLLDDPRPESGLTATGAVVGTPQYMAPEQIERPGEVDHRADIYSLGVVFYELLTGELPLGRFAPPSAKADLDARIDEIVMRALAKERELRQQSAREVKTEVEGIPTGRTGAREAGRDEASAGRSVPEVGVEGPGALWRLPVGQKQVLLGLIGVGWAMLAYLLVTSWGPFVGFVVTGLSGGGGPAFGAVTGLGVAAVLSGWAWSRRQGWLHPLRPPRVEMAKEGTGDVDFLLGVMLVGWVIGLGVQALQMLASQGWMLGEGLARVGRGEWWAGGGMAAMAVAPPVLLVGGAAFLVRREGRRPAGRPAGEAMPGWALRVAAGLLVFSMASDAGAISPTVGTGVVYIQPTAAFLVLTSIALWTGSRVYRAVALALNGLLLAGGWLNLTWWVAAQMRGAVAWPPEVLVEENPMRFWLLHPWGMTLMTALSTLGPAAGLVTLLHPSVRRAFGVLPGSEGVGPTGAGAAPVREGAGRDRAGGGAAGWAGLPEAWKPFVLLGLLVIVGLLAKEVPVLIGVLGTLLAGQAGSGWPAVLLGCLPLWLVWRLWRPVTGLLAALGLTPAVPPPGAGRGTGGSLDRWLRWSVVAVLILLGLRVAIPLLVAVASLARALGQGDGRAGDLRLVLFLAIVAVVEWRLWREQRRTDLVPPRPAPPWMRRMAVGLAVLAVVAEWVLGMGRRWALAGTGGFPATAVTVAVAVLALVTRGRYWRAMALPLNVGMLGWLFLGGLPGGTEFRSLVEIAAGGGGVLPVDLNPRRAVTVVYGSLVGGLAHASAVASLLLPSARAAFGLRSRRSSGGMEGVQPRPGPV